MFTEFEKGTKPVGWKPLLPFCPSSFEGKTHPRNDVFLVVLVVQFKPLEQLMGVFPAASGNFLPDTWRNLMSSPVGVCLGGWVGVSVSLSH